MGFARDHGGWRDGPGPSRSREMRMTEGKDQADEMVEVRALQVRYVLVETAACLTR